MKHLIPYLQDDRKAADYLRLTCVHCAVRLGQLFAMFTDWTRSIFEESKVSPLAWLLVMGLWPLKRNATDIAAAADSQERTAQRCLH